MRQILILFMALTIVSCTFEIPPEEYVVYEYYHDQDNDHYYEFIYVEHEQVSCPGWVYGVDDVYNLFNMPYPHAPVYCDDNSLVSCCVWTTHTGDGFCHERWCTQLSYPECGWYLSDEGCY